MELDVHLTREGQEPWGFEFIGGSDTRIPLTIDKVTPSSPADFAGLQPGDIVARLGDTLATQLSQAEARDIVAESVGSLSFGICRGLYDPVLDDYEPIYEPIERAGSDPRSEPTEVQTPLLDPLDLSLDDPNILDPKITDPNMWDSGFLDPLSRSLTSSPFVPNTKPYRPFSTEPLEVPALDDPIILNPNYKDNFNFKDNVRSLEPGEEDLLRLIPLDREIESKFKLPISEKYDPDWGKKVKEMLEKCADSGKHESRKVEQELVCLVDKSIVSNVKTSKNVIETKDTKRNETKEMITVEENATKIDRKSIEETALEIVEESIERAVSVTEEIQKEVENELRASMTRESTEDVAEIKNHIEVESTVERKQSVVKSEATELIQRESKVSEEIQTEKLTDEEMNLKRDQKFVEERRLSAKKEMEEMIETGNVRKKSLAFDKSEIKNDIKEKEKSRNTSTQHEIDEAISVGTVKRQSMAFDKAEDGISIRTEAIEKSSQVEGKKVKSEHEKDNKSSAMISNSEGFQSESKQRAFLIGLQTIPHVKGFVQSSYHFDLLLRTFFVHLTDVMVALSRFILTQPATELENKIEKVIQEKLIKDFTSHEQYDRKEMEAKRAETKQSVEVKHDTLQEKSVKQEAKLIQVKEESQKAKTEVKTEENKYLKKETKEAKQDMKQAEDNYVREFETRKKSGAEMAQRTQRKSQELTKKMDAVITEFETKTGVEDRLEVTEQRRSRSRSRSQIEEEVMKESDPLEWLDKVDSRRASVERTDVTVKKGFSTVSESKESKRSETKRQSRKTSTKPGKQMYVAIVESHVYTNEDAILEDQAAEMSETASVQSSEEINAALESFEAISTENVAITNVQSEEKQQAVEVITNALEEIVQEKQEAFETVTDFKTEINKQHSKSIINESHVSIAAESTQLVSEMKAEMLKIKEVNESKAVVQQEESYKTAAIEFVDIPLEATKAITTETKAEEKEAVAKKEILETVASESTEIIEESEVKEFKATEVVSKTAAVTTEENFKTAALNTTELLLEETKEEEGVKISEAKAIAKVESLAIAVAQATDVAIDDSEVKTFESKELISKKAKLSAEETFKKAAVGIEEVSFETAEEKHSDLAKTSQVIVKEENQHLAVAGIIETKTEVCKEPKKAEDEYASLKIVKEEIIDSVETEYLISESELNVKKSSDIEMSSSKHIETSQTYQSIQKSSVQESYHSSAKSNLQIRTDLTPILERQISEQCDENNNTPSPSVPPTPLTDEYVFKLEIPLPKNQGTIVVEESPDREDPHIVKKGLIPHIETSIEDQIIYDPPLATPPTSPVYTKPGLRGGNECRPFFKKEYIREIERKSSLLASAIDQTIKSIEIYKEEVGIDQKRDKTHENEKKDNASVTNGVCTDKKVSKTDEQVKTNSVGVTNGDEDVTTDKSGIHEGMTNGYTNRHNQNGVDELNELQIKNIEQKENNNINVEQLSKDGSETTCEKGTENGQKETEALPGFKPVKFNPEEFQARLYEEVIKGTESPPVRTTPYITESGETLGTVQGIVDGLEEATVDEELAKELGKPGLSEDKIAELISGESEMLREAHVMGLSRVITSHMTRTDDSSVDFQKIKPLVESLKDSEVLKALNEELLKEKKAEKKKEETKWTTFLQKPMRPVPRAKFGYYGYVEAEAEEIEEPYKVKIVKQPKPKVAPDYKPEDFDTGPLPWELRSQEPVPSPTPPEEPILIPEETPQFLEAVDPLPESELPDLEDTGIPLPSPSPKIPETPQSEEINPQIEDILPPPEEDQPLEPEQPPLEEEPKMQDQNMMAEQLVKTVKGMVDPNAPLEQQLAQMRAQLAALAQLPAVIQQSLELLTSQLTAMNRQESNQMSYESQMNVDNYQQVQIQVTENTMETIQEYQEQTQNNQEVTQDEEQGSVTIEEVQEMPIARAEEMAAKKREEATMEEQIRREKEKKEQEQMRLQQESRQLKQRAPRVGKPKPVFGPPSSERPLVLPGGRRWRGPKDAYNEQMINETLQAQSEILQGKVMGYESDLLPYDNRINFMKYEKPPVSLDHLQNSATYKLIHNMEQEPVKRVEMLTPVVAEADYRERCRSATPNMQMNGRM